MYLEIIETQKAPPRPNEPPRPALEVKFLAKSPEKSPRQPQNTGIVAYFLSKPLHFGVPISVLATGCTDFLPRSPSVRYSIGAFARYTLRVSNEPDPRLAVLTGEVLKLMAEGGASAAAIGHVALNYPALVAKNLEPIAPPPPPQEIDLEAVIRSTVQTLFGLGFAGHPTPALESKPENLSEQRRSPRVGSRVKVNVVVGGKRTSVKLHPAIHEKLSSLPGDQKVEHLVQSFVDSAPADYPNRSAWVEEHAAQFLVLSELRPAIARGH